jgi:uncharacterized phage-associated protein
MVSAAVLANNIIKRAFEEEISLTPMKLQKLLYFVYKEFLKDTDCSLFAENFMVWKYGPVLQSVCDKFKGFGVNKITKFERDSLGNVYIADENNLDLSRAVNKVWSRYKKLDGIHLSTLTHRSGSAWDKARIDGESVLRDEDIKNEPEFH